MGHFLRSSFCHLNSLCTKLLLFVVCRRYVCVSRHRATRRALLRFFLLSTRGMFNPTHLAVAGAKPAQKSQPCIIYEASATTFRVRLSLRGSRPDDISPSVHDDVEVVVLAAEGGDSWRAVATNRARKYETNARPVGEQLVSVVDGCQNRKKSIQNATATGWV